MLLSCQDPLVLPATDELGDTRHPVEDLQRDAVSEAVAIIVVGGGACCPLAGVVP